MKIRQERWLFGGLESTGQVTTLTPSPATSKTDKDCRLTTGPVPLFKGSFDTPTRIMFYTNVTTYNHHLNRFRQAQHIGPHLI